MFNLGEAKLHEHQQSLSSPKLKKKNAISIKCSKFL